MRGQRLLFQVATWWRSCTRARPSWAARSTWRSMIPTRSASKVAALEVWDSQLNLKVSMTELSLLCGQNSPCSVCSSPCSVGRTLHALCAEFSLFCVHNSPCSVGRTLHAMCAELSLFYVQLSLLCGQNSPCSVCRVLLVLCA